MKTLLTFLCIFAVYLTTDAMAQEMLAGGNMEDSTAWKVVHLDSQVRGEYEFNYISDGPAEGQGGCLEVTASGTSGQWTNILFYQKVTLIGGAEYEFKGAFKDLAGTIQEFWCDVRWDTLEPPQDNTDFGGTLIVGFNTWDGSQPGVDGTFQDDGSATNNIFTAPGASGQPVDVYIAIGVGSGAWANPNFFFDVTIDELSLTPVGGSAVEERRSGVAEEFGLSQNYPNPFNPQTRISYSLSQTSTVTLRVYDPTGREVATLAQNEKKAPGTYEVAFDAAQLPSGVYFYRLQAGSFIKTKKMLLIK
jgi:hypothetical protein